MATLNKNVWVVPYTTQHPVFLEAGTDDEHEYAYLVQNENLWDGTPKHHDDDKLKEEARAAAPPRTGKGSNRKAWVNFANEFDVDVDDNDSKEEIIAELEAIGII